MAQEPVIDEIETTTEAEETETVSYGPPKGAMVFALLMLAFYIIYFALTYLEIVLQRGQ